MEKGRNHSLDASRLVKVSRCRDAVAAIAVMVEGAAARTHTEYADARCRKYRVSFFKKDTLIQSRPHRLPAPPLIPQSSPPDSLVPFPSSPGARVHCRQLFGHQSSPSAPCSPSTPPHSLGSFHAVMLSPDPHFQMPAWLAFTGRMCFFLFIPPTPQPEPWATVSPDSSPIHILRSPHGFLPSGSPCY